MRVRGHALILLASLLALSSACSKGKGATVNTRNLAITMSFLAGENSRDSNSQLYSLTLTGDSVTYAGPHPPCQRGRCAHGEVKFKLSKKVYDEAILAITRGGLTGAFSETKALGGSGNYVKVTATVTLDDKTGETTVIGMSHSLEAESEVLTKDAQARSEAVRMLLNPFRLAGESRLPKE